MRPPRFSRPDRRDAFLILIGALAVLLGYAYQPSTATAAVHASLHTATEYVPLWAYSGLWVATGLVSIGSAFTRRVALGFTVAVIMPTVWGLAYFVGWLNDDAGRGWVLAALFWTLAGAVFCVSGLIDPTPVLRRRGWRS